MSLSAKKIIIFTIFLISVFSYLQFKLLRVPHATKVYNYGAVQCLTDLPKKQNKSNRHNQQDARLLINKNEQNSNQNYDDEQQDESQIQEQQNKKVQDKDNFKQICYEKDISYSIQLFNKKKELLLMSMDLTAPISWVKSQKCYIAQTHRKCERIQKNYMQQFQRLTKKFKQLLKNPLKKKQKKKKSVNDNEYALIQGSSQVVKGILQKTQALQFMTTDSGRLTRFVDLMLLGMFFIGINVNLNLQNTTFISATQISPALNYLCDGAISLRFDQNSQSSFLKQMGAVAKSSENYVTIFVGEHNQTMSIGDLTVKNAAHGLSGIKWIAIQQDEEHGKLARASAIQLTESDSQIHKQVKVKLPLVLTLSSSTITIPKQQLQQVFEKFFPKKKCSINQASRYMQCEKLSSSDYQKKQLNFVTNQTNIMVPFKNLVLEQKRHRVTFNIKSSLDSRYIILGEPVFKVYFVVLDYQNNRIGLAYQRTKFAEAIIDAVSLIRFVVWAFILGTCSICFLLPLQRCYTLTVNKIAAARNKNKRTKKYKGTSAEKANIKYTQVEQQNPYEDLRGKIQQTIHEQALGI